MDVIRFRVANLLIVFSAVVVLTTACAAPPTQSAPPSSPTATTAPTPTAAPTLTPVPATATLPPTQAGPTSTPWPEDWRDMPVVPTVSDTARAIYQHGLALGRDPTGFSIIGDCQNVAAFFLSAFATPGQYDLGDYPYLEEVIAYYRQSQSFTRERVAAIGGFNVAAILSPLLNNNPECDVHESPLACEYRINNPSVALISMETWGGYDRPSETYQSYLEQVVQYSVDQGVVPILATKADNLEGDNSINQAIYNVARKYDVPLWNFWRAVQPLPDHGLSSDQFHLTYARPFFNNPANMRTAWPVRNLTALAGARRGVAWPDGP